jgi:hypothetical protein
MFDAEPHYARPVEHPPDDAVGTADCPKEQTAHFNCLGGGPERVLVQPVYTPNQKRRAHDEEDRRRDGNLAP